MSVENENVRELMALLAKEQSLMGKYYGHEGQRRVALREAEYWDDAIRVCQDENINRDPAIYERKKQKALARAEYHKRMAEEARKELEKVRKQIREITKGDKE